MESLKLNYTTPFSGKLVKFEGTGLHGGKKVSFLPYHVAHCGLIKLLYDSRSVDPQQIVFPLQADKLSDSVFNYHSHFSYLPTVQNRV